MGMLDKTPIEYIDSRCNILAHLLAFHIVDEL